MTNAPSGGNAEVLSSVYPWVVAVDSSWEDTHCPCYVCGVPVPWREAVLMPTSITEDLDEVGGCTIIHRRCPEATP